MPAALEVVFAANVPNDVGDGAILKLDHLAARLAVEVLVLRVAVVVLVEHARPQFQAAQQAGVHQLGQGAVDRRPADGEAGPLPNVLKGTASGPPGTLP